MENKEESIPVAGTSAQFDPGVPRENGRCTECGGELDEEGNCKNPMCPRNRDKL